MEVGIHEAKTNLSRLIRRVAAGEEITITRSGKPIARMVPIEGARLREFGYDEGLFTVPNDFNEPLPDELLAEFES